MVAEVLGQALERALAEASFVLEVRRVDSVEEEVEIRQWKVETRQGPRSFQTHLDDWPRVLPMGGLLIRDVSGDLYRLPDPAPTTGFYGKFRVPQNYVGTPKIIISWTATATTGGPCSSSHAASDAIRTR